MKREIYRTLLHLYPREYQAAFAQEMLASFDEAAVDCLKWGFTTRELAGLLFGALGEWYARWTRGKRYAESCEQAGPECDLERRLHWLVGRIEFAIAHHDFPAARRYCEEERLKRDQFHRSGN